MKSFFQHLVLLSLLGSLSSAVHANSYDNEWENVAGKEANANADYNQDAEVASARKLSREEGDSGENMRVASSTRVRRFHEVLDELLAEFAYDVKMGQLKGLKNLSIRKVDVSRSLPQSYKNYLELLVAERIRENSRVRLISCIPCKAKTSRLVDGKLLITSPSTNVGRLLQAADQLGIDYFMDVVLVYHTTHMVLAMQVFNATTQEMVWTRTYNSETIKSRYQKLAVDFKQIEKSRPGEDYVPEYRFLFGVGGGMIPNTNNKSSDNGVINVFFRGSEKFDNRKHEFGLQLDSFIRKNSILGNHDTEDDSSAAFINPAASDVDSLTPWSTAFALYGIYARHFVGNLESYNDLRHAINFGIGFVGASAYVTGSARAGWDIYFGRRFSMNLSVIYLAPAPVDTDIDTIQTKGGVGGIFSIALNL